MPVNNEIERKWLIDKDNIPFNLENAKKINMKQGYISFSPTIRIRSENESRYVLCVKTSPSSGGLLREEFETDISKKQFENLSKKIEGLFVEKTRYIISDKKGHNMEIDIFSGNLSGLAYLEIEFCSESEAMEYRSPVWTVKDVTNDKRYKNASLARLGIPK